VTLSNQGISLADVRPVCGSLTSSYARWAARAGGSNPPALPGHLGESRAGRLDGSGNGCIWSRGRELRVVGGQLCGATFLVYLVSLDISEPHNFANWEICSCDAARNEYYVSKVRYSY